MTMVDTTTEAMTETAWRGVLALANTRTGDGRIMREVTWRTPPLPLKWQKVDDAGHVQSMIVGRIDTLALDGDLVNGTGVLFATPEAMEASHLIESRALRGVSVDPGGYDVVLHEDGLTEFTRFEIGAATLVAVPAFAGAWVVLDGMDDPVDAEAEQANSPEGTVEFQDAEGDPEDEESVVAAVVPVDAPDPALFAAPDLDRRYGMHVEADGRIWGHIYGWGECHVGSPHGRCIQVPRGSCSQGIFADLDGRGVLCSDGSLAPTGPIVLAADHAALSLGWHAARDHYAHTGLAVADVAVGEDEHGVWVAGMIRPGVDPALVHALRASAPSGDWRRLGNHLELVAILAVNSPGYPAVAASVDGGTVYALVASSGPVESVESCSCGGSCGACIAVGIEGQIPNVEETAREVVRAAPGSLLTDPAETLAALDAEMEPHRPRLADLVSA